MNEGSPLKKKNRGQVRKGRASIDVFLSSASPKNNDGGKKNENSEFSKMGSNGLYYW